MSVFIPSPIHAIEQFFIILDGTQYQFQYQYSADFDYWMLQVNLGEDVFIEPTMLSFGVPVETNLNLSDFGSLFLFSDSGVDDDPNLENFGVSVFLQYEPL